MQWSENRRLEMEQPIADNNDMKVEPERKNTISRKNVYISEKVDSKNTNSNYMIVHGLRYDCDEFFRNKVAKAIMRAHGENNTKLCLRSFHHKKQSLRKNGKKGGWYGAWKFRCHDEVFHKFCHLAPGGRGQVNGIEISWRIICSGEYIFRRK